MPFFFLFLKNPKVIAVLLIVGLLTAGYFHYKGLVANLKTLEANAVKMTLVVAVQEVTATELRKTVAKWSASQKEFHKQLEKLRNVSAHAAEERNKLAGMFAKHKLKKLALAKPGLVERLANRGTRRTLRLLEQASSETGSDTTTKSGATGSESSTAKPGFDKAVTDNLVREDGKNSDSE